MSRTFKDARAHKNQRKSCCSASKSRDTVPLRVLCKKNWKGYIWYQSKGSEKLDRRHCFECQHIEDLMKNPLRIKHFTLKKIRSM